MVGRPSIEAMAMSGADWSRYSAADGDEGAPPEHLRAFEAFLETVVPVDMALAFSRDEAAVRARRGGRRRSHQEDVEEKLKFWAKAVAREAKAGGMLGSQPQQATTSRRRAHAREPVIVARPPGESNWHASGGKEKGAETLISPKQAPVGKLGLHTNRVLAPSLSPCSGRRGEPCQSNQPLPKQDIKSIFGV